MRHVRIAALAALLLAGLTQAAAAQECAGDCDGGGDVAINELIVCVNIALGSAPVANCSPCDVDASGDVAINELIAAVNRALSGCEDPGDEVCGDGGVNVEGETCDDGNNLGGDGCAANCTAETRRETQLDPARAKATAQALSLAIPLPLTGTQALTVGDARPTAVRGKDGTVIFQPLEVPVVIRAEDVRFNPIKVFGLVCACVRGVAAEDFGTGISGIGRIGCGEEGLLNIDFVVEKDHNTTPGSPGNGGPSTGMPDDPECDDTLMAGDLISSAACSEGTGEACSLEGNSHTGVCQSPNRITFSGGQGPRGSVMLFNSTAIGLLEDEATCAESRLPNGNCRYADYGPDCKPCTDDDLEKGMANIAPTTSGTATVQVYDVNNTAGIRIAPGSTCGGTTPCVTTVSGSPVDCDEILSSPNAPLRSTLATAFPSLDSTVGDILVTTTLAAQQ
jgi:cysteine-rich repeat protein